VARRDLIPIAAARGQAWLRGGQPIIIPQAGQHRWAASPPPGRMGGVRLRRPPQLFEPPSPTWSRLCGLSR